MHAMSIGDRVQRKGWSDYPGVDHLARRGRVTRIAGPHLVEVRWDSAAEAALYAGIGGVHSVAPLGEVISTGAIEHLWWRST